jgi:outer membrane protein/protease secretion system outer membrane protein
MALALSVAATAPAWSLDLLQSYEAALEQDATVRAARAAADSGRERLPQARSQLLPNLSFSAGRNKNDLLRTQPNSLGKEVTTQENYISYNQTLTLRQSLYRRQQATAYEQARFIVDDANAVLERELQNLGVRVGTAYMEALLATDQLNLVLAQKAVTTTQLEVARKAFAAGSGTRTDIDEAQARLDMTMAQELEVRQNLDYTRRQLQVLINRPVDSLEPLNIDRLPLLVPVPAQLEDWTLLAQQKSPEVASLTARLEAARLEIRKAESAHYPTLDAVAQWTRSGSENVTSPNSSYINRAIGLQLSVPLYAGGYVDSTVRQALAEQVRAEEQLEAVKRDLGVRVHKEFRGVTEGILRIKALEQAVRSAEQLVVSSRKSFQAGSRTLMDILNAEQQKQTTLRDLAQARYLYLVARIRLLALAGTDARQGITETNGWLGR